MGNAAAPKITTRSFVFQHADSGNCQKPNPRSSLWLKANVHIHGVPNGRGVHLHDPPDDYALHSAQRV